MLQWLPAIVIFVYLAIVLYIGIFAFRKGRETGEDFFLASRSIGSIVFFLSLFATNMTAFAILGSSGMAYKIGIGVFGMMATSSALVIPLTLFFIGTRLWAVGKRFGHVTQVSFFRDRYECSFIGTIIFLVTAAMLVPYLIISIDGGGTILHSLTNGKISYPIGGAIVAIIVMATVFFGGMRGAVWVNVLQTILFIAFGIVAFAWIDKHMPYGFDGTVDSMIHNKANLAACGQPHGPAHHPPDARAHSLAGLPQLHADSALLDHVPPYVHDVLHRQEGHGIQKDGRALSPVHHGHLASLRFPGRAGATCAANEGTQQRQGRSIGQIGTSQCLA